MNHTTMDGIHLILWSNDVVLDENYLYTFKYITIG